MRASISILSTSSSRPPPWFSDSTSLICASASSSRRDTMSLSFCSSSLELFLESLRWSDDGGAKLPFSTPGELLFAARRATEFLLVSLSLHGPKFVLGRRVLQGRDRAKRTL